VYLATQRYNQTLLEGEQRSWQEIPANERGHLPLCGPIGSLIEGDPDAHYERVPLCELTEILARMNAQASVAAMGGSEFMQRKSAALQQKRLRRGKVQEDGAA
jgi:hypothetical protein